MYKSLLNISVKDLDQQGRVVVAANAFGNVDSDNDVSMPGSFDKTLSENFMRLKWYKNHNRNELLGVPIEGKATQDYLQITGQLNMNKQLSRDIYEDYKLYAEYGKTLEHSIGVDPIRYQDDQGIRKVTQWKLWEYSTLTSWGANERTPMLDLKGASVLSDIDFLEIKLKKGNYTDEAFAEIEQSIERLKSLCTWVPTTHNGGIIQPITADVLADASKQFLKSLQTN